MTTYATKNPIGSMDPKDLFDNAQNLDFALNDITRTIWKDRFGRDRKSYWGLEQDFYNQLQAQANTFSAQIFTQEQRFNLFIQSSGYAVIGDYSAGPLTITEYNQLIRYNGELWKLTAATNIPFTTTGNDSASWANDSSHFVSVADAVLRQQLSDVDGATKYPEFQIARWRDEGDIRGWGARGNGVADDSAAFQAAIDSGATTVRIPATHYLKTPIQLPARDITLIGNGRGSVLKGDAAQLIKYPLSDAGFQNIHGITFIVKQDQVGIQMHKIWTSDGKEEVQVTGCHFFANATGVTFISVKGIWSGRIQNNEMFGTSRANDTYGIKFVTDDSMNSSVMNLDISNNKQVLVAYPVYYGGRTITSGGRLEGISINNNKTIGSKIGIRLSSTLATVINGNLIHDSDLSAIELNGDFDFVINGNVELWGGEQAILIQGIVGSIAERGVVSANKINAGNGINGVVLRANGTAPRSISITGNMIGRQASGAQTGTGVKIDSVANVNNITVTGNAFQQLDTAIDRGGQAGDVVTLGNSFVFVTNTGVGMQSTPFTKSTIITLIGGAVSEALVIDLPAGVTNKRPQFAMALGTGSGTAQSVIGFYDFDNSTASQLKFNLMRIDRAVMGAGTIRVHIMANLF
ncbi:TPA: hypothetical protein ACQ8P9_000974 [Escherichia coli]|nr:hypothetical protein [Escherichia coli]